MPLCALDHIRLANKLCSLDLELLRGRSAHVEVCSHEQHLKAALASAPCGGPPSLDGSVEDSPQHSCPQRGCYLRQIRPPLLFPKCMTFMEKLLSLLTKAGHYVAERESGPNFQEKCVSLGSEALF